MEFTKEAFLFEGVLSCAIVHGGSCRDLIMEEENQGAGLRKVTVVMPDGNWVGFFPDKGRKLPGMNDMMSPLLKHDHGYNCACDCVVVFFDRKSLTIVYIEMKSLNPDSRHYVPQFQSTRQFMRYVVGLLNEFHGAGFTLEDVNEHYIVLHLAKNAPASRNASAAPKQRVVTPSAREPKRHAVVNDQRLHLRHLLGYLPAAVS